MKKNFFLIKLSIIFSIFLIDQISKYYIINNFKFQNEVIYLTSFLNLQLIWNDGIAFGLLSFENNLYYNLITIVIIGFGSWAYLVRNFMVGTMQEDFITAKKAIGIKKNKIIY